MDGLLVDAASSPAVKSRTAGAWPTQISRAA
jgi:hypothetical protein